MTCRKVRYTLMFNIRIQNLTFKFCITSVQFKFDTESENFTLRCLLLTEEITKNISKFENFAIVFMLFFLI